MSVPETLKSAGTFEKSLPLSEPLDPVIARESGAMKVFQGSVPKCIQSSPLEESEE